MTITAVARDQRLVFLHRWLDQHRSELSRDFSFVGFDGYPEDLMDANLFMGRDHTIVQDMIRRGLRDEMTSFVLQLEIHRDYQNGWTLHPSSTALTGSAREDDDGADEEDEDTEAGFRSLPPGFLSLPSVRFCHVRFFLSDGLIKIRDKEPIESGVWSRTPRAWMDVVEETVALLPDKTWVVRRDAMMLDIGEGRRLPFHCEE